jgi:hypothetical protein
MSFDLGFDALRAGQLLRETGLDKRPATRRRPRLARASPAKLLASQRRATEAQVNFNPCGSPVGSILRHGEDGAWRCDTAQRMRSERYQRDAGLSGECVRDKDDLVERPA